MTTPNPEELEEQSQKAGEAVLVGGQSYQIGPRQTSMPSLRDLMTYQTYQAHLAALRRNGDGGFAVADLKGAS